MPIPIKRKQEEIPAQLKPFVEHGTDFRTIGDSQAVAECPFCGAAGKFFVGLSEGLWDCKVCSRAGNPTVFVRTVWEESRADLTPLKNLADERGLLGPETLEKWGVRVSGITGEWIVPGFNTAGRVCQLYRWERLPGRSKNTLMATSGLGHYLFGVPLFDKACRTVYVCEGPWDAMALYEVMLDCRRAVRPDGSEWMAMAGTRSTSLLADASVIAAPGANVFMEQWGQLIGGRDVVILYDSDHPRLKCPKCTKSWSKITYEECPTCAVPLKPPEQPPSGLEGTKRACRVMAKFEDQPTSVSYLRWGPDGYDPALDTGHDLRDWLREGDGTKGGRPDRLRQLLSKVEPIPSGWSSAGAKRGSVTVDCAECTEWKSLQLTWRKSGLKWIDGLDKALAVMLAVCVSTEAVGDQLWIKVIGPPACGKSTLCEALSVNKRYVLAKSTIRGFHSGFRVTRDEDEDNSLLSSLKNKTLVTKDGDTLLQSPNLSQILSEARDVYDRVSRTHYRNKASKDYEGISMTWLLCGTSSLRSIDQSELGERFLDCVIVDEIDDDLEDEIGWRVANRAEAEMAYRSDGKMESRDGPGMVEAKRMTGGYLNYLRDNAMELLEQVQFPERHLRSCQRFAKFVALMRARPSLRQHEKVEREMSFRLISQHVRLAKCLAVVFNKPEVDDAVIALTRSVALDTARGHTQEIVRIIYESMGKGQAGVDPRVLATLLNETDDKVRALLRFMSKLKVVEKTTPPRTTDGPPRPVWRLTDAMTRLYYNVVIDRPT